MMLLYVAPLIFCAALGPILAVMIIRRGQSPGTPALVAMIFSASLWVIGYAAEIASVLPAAKIFWAKFQYFGIATLPLAWFLFANQFLGAPAWLVKLRKYALLLAVLPGLTIGLVWTNEIHRWIWTSETISMIGQVPMLKLGHGAWFFVYWIYGNLLVLLGTIWLIRSSFATNSLLRWQIGLVLIGAVFPWAGNLMYVSGFNPLKELDWTPLGFTMAGVFFTLSISRYQMAKVIPVAHRMVFEEVTDVMVVVDLQDRIMDLNISAREMIGEPLLKTVGKKLPEMIPALISIPLNEQPAEGQKREVALFIDGSQRFYELQIILLTDLPGKAIGRLVVLHDFTRRKQEQVLLEKAYSELEDRVLERTEALQNVNIQLRDSHDRLRALTTVLQEAEAIERRNIAAELHDRVGQNLTALNLNLKRLQNKLPAEGKNSLQHILEDSESLLEETTRQVRNVMADLNPPMLEEYGLIPALTWYGEKFFERTGIKIRVTGDQINLRMPERVENALFRIAQECLNNVAKHSQASTVTIGLKMTRETIILCLEDNGIGFDKEDASAAGEQPHWGLMTMRERALSVNGDLNIQSSTGKGTQVDVVVRRMLDVN